MTPKSYVAFLRGINVGGKTLLKMAELKRVFESVGASNVTTILASGNVVFEAADSSLTQLQRRTEQELKSVFHTSTRVILRRGDDILKLIRSDPFESTKLSASTKLQVSFLSGPVRQGGRFPKVLAQEPFRVVQISPGEVCSALELTDKLGTPELMMWLEKRFGKEITTRTWNTLLKIGKALEA